MDVAASSLTSEEYKQYYDPSTPQAVKDKLIAGKLKDAIKTVETMPAEEYKKRAKEAELRHYNSAIKNMATNTLMPQILDLEKGLPDDKKLLAPLLHNYIQELAKGQDANNQLLTKDGKPIVGPEPKEKEAGEKAKEETKTIKYGDLYPLPPNKEKFLKLMSLLFQVIMTYLIKGMRDLEKLV